MTAYIKPLRRSALAARILSVLLLFFALLDTAQLLVSLFIDQTIHAGLITTFVLDQAEKWAIPLLLWAVSLMLYAVAALIEDMFNLRRQLLQPAPKKKTDEELYGLPRPRNRPPEVVQPPAPPPPAINKGDERFAPPRRPQVATDAPRPKLENKPKLTQRLYTIRWNGKAPRSVRQKTRVNLD